MGNGISEALIVSLFIFIESVSGYAAPAAPPEIRSVPAAEIAERVCGRPCPVRAAYIAGEGIIIDQTFDFARHAYAQSVLVHELVHAAQDESGAFAGLAPCRRHSQRELEAYWVQDAYLRRVTGSGLKGMHKGNRLWPRCFDD